jgi:hypothetical protein
VSGAAPERAERAAPERIARGAADGSTPRMNEIATDVWQVDGPALKMSGGFVLPASSTVIRLPDRRLLVYSPIAFDDAAAAAIDAAGEVAHLVAPSRLHHMFAEAAKARWPKAAVHAAPGVAEKQPGLKIDHELGGAGDAPWGDAIALERIGGAPKANEVVLFHRPSGTLVCADLVFHVTRPANLCTRLILGMMGAGGGRLAQSRIWSFLRKDRDAARASVERIRQWPISRIAPCHGAAVEIDAAGLAREMTRLCGGRVAS